MISVIMADGIFYILARLARIRLWLGSCKKQNPLSEVVDRALSEGPQTITRHGRPAVVVVAAEQYARETQREKLSRREKFDASVFWHLQSSS